MQERRPPALLHGVHRGYPGAPACRSAGVAAGAEIYDVIPPYIYILIY